MANEFGVESDTEIGAMPIVKIDGEEDQQIPGSFQSKAQKQMFDIAAARAADNENEEAFAGMPTEDLRKRLEYTRLEARARMMASSPNNFQDEEFGAIFKELNARRFIADERTLSAFDMMDGDGKVTNLSRLNEFLAFSDKLSAAKDIKDQQAILDDRFTSPELKAWREATRIDAPNGFKEGANGVKFNPDGTPISTENRAKIAREFLEKNGRSWGDKVASLRGWVGNPNDWIEGTREERLSDQRAISEYEKTLQGDVLRSEAAKVMPFLTEAQRNLVNIYAAGGEVPQGVFKAMKPEDREMMYSMCQAVRPEWNGNWLEEMGVRAYGGVRSAFRSMNRADKAFTDVALNKAGQFLFGKDNMWSTPEEREALRKGMIDDIHWAESVHDIKLKDPEGFVKKALEGYADSASMQYSMLGGVILKRAGDSLKGTWGGVAASSAGWALEGYTAASMIGEQFDNMLLRGVPLENAAPLAVCGGLVDTYIETMNLKTWFGKNLSPAEMKRVGIRAGFRAALKMDGKEFLKVLKTNAKQAIQIAESEVKEEMLQGANKEGWCSLAEGRNALDAFTSSDVYREGMNSFWDALPSCTAFGVFGAANPTGSISKSANGAYQEHLQQISGIVAKRMGLKDVGSATEQYAYQMAQNEAARIAKATDGMSVKERNAWINAQTDLSLAEKEFYAEHCDMFAASVAQDGAAWANAHLSGSINEAMFVKAGWKFGHDEQGYINSVTTSQGDVIPVELKNREARIEDFDGKRLDEFVSEYNRLNPDNPLNKDDAEAVYNAVSQNTNGWYANGKITLFGARASGGTLAHESTHGMIERLSKIGTKEANQAVKALVSTLGGKGLTISLAGEESVAYENEENASAAELTNLGLKDEVSIKALAKNIVTAVKKAVGRGKGQEFVPVYRTAEGIEYDPSEFLHDVIARSLAAYQRKQDLAAAQAKERKEAGEKFKAEREAKRQKKIEMRKAEATQRAEEAKAREDALKAEAEAALKAKQEELKKSAMEVAERNRVEAEFRKMWEDRLAIAADQRKAAEAVANYEAWKNDEAHKEDVRKAQDAMMQEVLAEIAKEEQDALDAIDRKYEEEFKLIADEEERNEAIRKAEEERQSKMAEQMLKNRKNATKEPPRLGHAKNQDGETAQRARAAYLAAWKAKSGKALSQGEIDQLEDVYGLPPEALNLKKTGNGYRLTDGQMLTDESLAKFTDGLVRLYADISSVKIIVPDVVVATAEDAANAVPNEVYDPVTDTFVTGRVVVDAANAKTLREQAGMKEPEVSPAEIAEAMERRGIERKVPSGKQKQADTDYPSAADEIREYKFSIKKSARDYAFTEEDSRSAEEYFGSANSPFTAKWISLDGKFIRSGEYHAAIDEVSPPSEDAWNIGDREYGGDLGGFAIDRALAGGMIRVIDGGGIIEIGNRPNDKQIDALRDYFDDSLKFIDSIGIECMGPGDNRFWKEGYKSASAAISDIKEFYDSVAEGETHFSLGKKARDDAKALILKKRPDIAWVRKISDEEFMSAMGDAFVSHPDGKAIQWKEGTKAKDIESASKDINASFVVDEIGKFATPKEQKAALHWFIKGAIRLPEDAPKVTEAIQYGERAKGKANTDPMSYDSPMAMIDALHEFKPKAKPINPDKVPQLSDKREMGNGVVTYLVQDDRDGQQAMREIINTHWGEDANPWCLLHGDGYGHLSDGSNGGYDAWHYWNHYNALPKRVAFKDGKLLAFMATDNTDDWGENGDSIEIVYPEIAEEYNQFVEENPDYAETLPYWFKENHPAEYNRLKKIPEQWWDRQDASHEGIPLGNIPVPGDAFGRWADFEIRDGEMKRIGGYVKWNNGNRTEWYANGYIASKQFVEGGVRKRIDWNERGLVDSYSGERYGTKVNYIHNEDGEMYVRKVSVGPQNFNFDENGDLLSGGKYDTSYAGSNDLELGKDTYLLREGKYSGECDRIHIYRDDKVRGGDFVINCIVQLDRKTGEFVEYADDEIETTMDFNTLPDDAKDVVGLAQKRRLEIYKDAAAAKAEAERIYRENAQNRETKFSLGEWSRGNGSNQPLTRDIIRGRLQKVREAENAEIVGDEFALTGDYNVDAKTARDWAKNNIRGTYTNDDTGVQIIVYSGKKRGGIKKVLSHSVEDKAHLQSVAAIPQIIEKSILLGSLPNSKKTQEGDAERYDYYACGLKIGNEDYVVKSVISINANGERYYDHALTEIEKGKLIDEILVNNQLAYEFLDGLYDTKFAALLQVAAYGTLQEQYADVVGKFRGTDKWMKAPNGNPTNLTERQWVQVRTPAFKAWFGDWENDPANASKVVDENGEPLVVYRGEEREQTEFKFGYNEQGWLVRNWFTSNPKVAEHFGNTHGRGYFLNIRIPAEYDAKGHRYYDLDYHGENVSNAVVDEVMAGTNADGCVLRNIVETDKFNDIGDDWLVNDRLPDAPNRIKSATDNTGAFDKTNPDIRFSLNGTEHRAIWMHDTKERDYTGRILDGSKKGETRNRLGDIIPGEWMGLASDINGFREIRGKAMFGEPIWITKESPEYKNALIEGDPMFDIDDSIGGKWYYPVIDKQEFTTPITEMWSNSPRGTRTMFSISEAMPEGYVDVDERGRTRFSIATYTNGGRDTLVKWMFGDVGKDLLAMSDKDLMAYIALSDEYKYLKGAAKTKFKKKLHPGFIPVDDKSAVGKGDLTIADGISIIRETDKVCETAQELAKTKKFKHFSNWSEVVVETDNDGNPIFGVVRPNGDYAYNLDFSTICKKRRPLDHIFASLVEDGTITDANINILLSEENIPKIQDIIKAHGLEVACALCFVDSKRYKIGEVAKNFSSMWNGILDMRENDPKKFEAAVRLANKKRAGEYMEKDEKTGEMKEAKPTFYDRAVMLISEDANARTKVDASWLISGEGMDEFARKFTAIHNLYRSFGGVSKAKDAHADVAWNNDIIRPFAHYTNPKSSMSSLTREKAYAVGGVRLQSFTDFIPALFFDYAQMTAELAAKHLPLHTYTKEVDFVKLFGLTGMKMNMSLVPGGTGVLWMTAQEGEKQGLFAIHGKDNKPVTKDGKVAFYDLVDECFPIKDAFDLRKGSKNVGTIMVGVSDEHILLMLDDPRIDMVIPYHKSSLNGVVATMRKIDKYDDYTDYQSTKKPDGAKDFDFYADLAKTQDPRKTASNYLAFCESKNFTAKFTNSRQGTNFSEHPNYYKLLADFRLFEDDGKTYAPQGDVTQTYPENLATLLEEAMKNDQRDMDALDRETEPIKNEVRAAVFKMGNEFAKAKNVGKVKKPSAKSNKFSIGNRSAENVAKFYLAREIIENKGRLPDTRRAMAVAKGIGYNGSVENLLRAAEQEAATQTQLLRYLASDPKTEKVLARAGLALRNERAIERARSAAVQFSREVSEAAEGTKKATERAVRQMRGEDYEQMLAREGLDLNAILLAIRPEEREQGERTEGAAEPKKPVVLDEAARNAVAQMAQEAVKNGAERIKEAQAMIAAKREDAGKKREDAGKKREDPSDPNGDIEYGNAVSAAFNKAIAEAGLTLDSPEAMVQLVKAITEKYIKDYPAEFTNLDPADIWSSPLARAKFAANLGAFAQAVADAYAPSYARVRIAKKAQLLNDKGLTSMRMIEEVGEELFRDLHGDVIRQSREGLIKDIKKILKPHAQHYTENELKQDRKGVDSALGRYCKFAYKCIKMSAAQVEERAKELEDELATWSGVAESEAERYREFADKKMELEMLDMFGNLKSRMPSELTALRDFVEQTINESRWETMQFGEKWEQSRVAGADAMMGGIEGNPKDHGVQPEDDDVSGLYSLIGMMETKAHQLTRFCKDDAKRGGSLKAFGMVEEMIQRAEDIQYNYAQMQKAKFVDLCKQVYGSEANAAEALSADIDESIWSKLDKGEQKTAWTIGRVMQMYVSCVQADYSENCAKYGRDGAYVQMLEDLINSMDPKHMDFIKGMRSMYMEQGDALSEVLEKTTGTRLLTPNRLYMPVQMLRDNNIAQKGRARAYNPFAPSLTPRVKNGLDFDQTMDIIDMWQSRLDDTAHTIAWADTGSMVQGICLSDRVLKAIRQAHGAKVMKQWNRYILDILAGAETGKIDNSNWGVKAMRFCARLASRTWLMLNPASWSKQLAAVPCFALSADGNLKDVGKSLAFCAMHPRQAAKVMHDLSETSAFKARYGVAISQEMKYATSDKGRFDTWIGRLVDLGMSGTMKFDEFGVYLLAGAYHNKRCEIEAQGKSAQEASELASSWLMHIVDKTAQTTRSVNTTELQRAGGAWGILLQFKSAPAQQTQFEITAIQDALANPKDSKRWKKAAVCILINHLIVPTINTAIESVLTCLTGWGLPDDEKRKRLIEMWIANCISGSLGSIVFIGTIAEAVGNLVGKVAVGDKPNMYDIRNSVGRQIPAAEMLNLWLNHGDKAVRAFCDITNGDIEEGVYELTKSILAVTPGASWASRKGFKAYESATEK